MVEQLDIFARATDPDTSHGYVPSPLARDLLEFIRANPDGWTAYELARRTKRQQNSVSRRLTELKEAGLIVAVGRKPGGYGRDCTVFVSAEQYKIRHRGWS